MTSNTKMTSLDAIQLKTVPKTPENDAGIAVVEKSLKPAKLFGVRHLQAFLLFLAMTLSFAMRVNLSVAIVAMTDRKSANPDYPEYDWDQQTTSLLLSSFYWGYFVANIPAGELAKKIGPIPLVAGTMFFASVLCSLTSLAADLGSWHLIALRVTQGFCQGSLFPCTHALLARWCPAEEMDVLSTFVYSGTQFGTVVALTLCGVLSVSSAGWPSCFYLFGIVGIVWSIAWIFLGSNSPAEHPFISQEERDYIQDSIGDVSSSFVGKPPTPWKEIFTSLPMWAIVVVSCGTDWGFFTLLTELPTYMKHVLGFDLASNGLLSALPYLVNFILSFFISSISAFINRRRFVTLTTSRKLFNTIGTMVPAIGIVGLTFSTDPTTSVALLTVTSCLSSAVYVGFHINHIDLAPNFAGTLMGLGNALSILVAVVAPLIVGTVVTDNTNESQWRTVFFISAGITVASSVFYLVFGSAKIQPWNEPRGHISTEVLTDDKLH